MENIEQNIIKIFEDKIDYQKFNDANQSSNENIIDSQMNFISLLKKRKGISIITGKNGIGKSYLLNLINETLTEDKKESKLIELKKIKALKELEEAELSKFEFVIFDGLDEIDLSIMDEVVNYIFSIEKQNVIVSGRKDFLQKNNMLNIKYNIYEIMPISENIVRDSIKIKELKNENLMSLLTTPRFLLYIKENIKDVKNLKEINKYNILNLIIEKHINELYKRSNTKIEKNIHKKVLQSMALVMMMTGKTNLSIEEFITFMSRIKYLDVKSYILNENVIQVFLNNQLLMHDGKLLQFENKELMEFLAAKEIIEIGLSNSQLYRIVTNNDKEILPYWFNTITYLVCGSRIYRKLILEYIYNNMNKQDGLLDLLLAINFKSTDKDYINKICTKLVFQYTKLYQYLKYGDNNISNILAIDYKDSLNTLVNILNNVDFKKDIDDFYIIYINNILSIIDEILEKNTNTQENNFDNIKDFIMKNEKAIIKNENFNVRYISIYLKVMDIIDIDKLLSSANINKRLFSIVLYEYKKINELQNLDSIVNNYIINYIDRFESDDSFYINDSIVKEFIINNYTLERMNKLIDLLNSNKNIASFLRFINESSPKFWKKFDKITVLKKLNNIIVKNFLNDESNNSDKGLKEEILFDSRQGDGFEKIIELCVKRKVIQITDILEINLSNYITKYVYELIIKKLIEHGEPIGDLYDSLSDPECIFWIWKNDIFNDEKNKYESEISRFFPNQYTQYIINNNKLNNKNYIDVENSMKKLLAEDNIYHMIYDIYYLLKEEKKYEIIISNTILNNTFKSIVKKIKNYIESMDISILNIKYNKKEKNYTFSYDIYLYPQAIYILNKADFDINVYNDKNIILLNNYDEDINIKYSDSDYDILIEYLTQKCNEGYLKYYLYSIIEKLRTNKIDELCGFILEWIEKYEFEEYEVNQLLGILCENINIVDFKQLDKIDKFKENKKCQDLLIQMNIENEIANRIEYIKKNLVYSGDIISIEEKYNFEYSSGYFTAPLTKIDIKYINYIIDITKFAFKKYNEGDYYYFTKYILDLATNFIKNNIDNIEICNLISIITSLEQKNNNRYLFNICNSISKLRRTNIKQLESTIIELNQIIESNTKKIYSYDDLFEIVKKILEKNVFDDIKRMNLFEIFKDKKSKKLNTLNEQTFQYLIGYELSRILTINGFSTEVVFETTGYDKKRGDIQLISEGFINNIIIETKLVNNSDLGSENRIKQYIKTTLNTYRLEFNSPKILFVIINQKNTSKMCENKIEIINKHNENFVVPVLINLNSIFK